MPWFFEGKTKSMINLAISQAIVLMHEVIHLTGKRDEDFADGKGQDAGSRALTDLIIHSCYSGSLNSGDLAL